MLFTLLHLQTFAQNSTGIISGTVKTSDGNPAPNVSVSIKEVNKGTISSETGTYLIKGLKEGTYTLKINYIGLLPQEKTVQVIAGKTVQTDFSLVETANKLAEIPNCC
jgi:iron complex outermembrane receptor protein